MTLSKRGKRAVVSFSVGGSDKEVAEAHRLFQEAGILAVGLPVEGLTQVEKTVPGRRTYVGLDGIREYIGLITEK